MILLIFPSSSFLLLLFFFQTINFNRRAKSNKLQATGEVSKIFEKTTDRIDNSALGLIGEISPFETNEYIGFGYSRNRNKAPPRRMSPFTRNLHAAGGRNFLPIVLSPVCPSFSCLGNKISYWPRRRPLPRRRPDQLCKTQI